MISIGAGAPQLSAVFGGHEAQRQERQESPEGLMNNASATDPLIAWLTSQRGWEVWARVLSLPGLVTGSMAVIAWAGILIQRTDAPAVLGLAVSLFAIMPSFATRFGAYVSLPFGAAAVVVCILGSTTRRPIASVLRTWVVMLSGLVGILLAWAALPYLRD